MKKYKMVLYVDKYPFVHTVTISETGENISLK
jgi:hypothetical protein